MNSREIAYHELRDRRRLDVRPFSPELEQRWDEFVTQADNGTLFHTRRFLNYHPPHRFQDASVIIEKDNNWRALFPAAAITRKGKRLLISHPGASFSGVVLAVPPSIKETFRIVDTINNHAAEAGYDEIVLTPPPQIYCSRPNNYLDFVLLQSGFSYVKRELSSVIPLDFAEDEILHKFNPASRRAVRKAINQGVHVTESQDYSRFYRILKRNLKLRHNVQPTHSLDELLRLSDLLSKRIRLLAAYKDGSMIAGVVLFLCNPSAALAFYISHDESMQEYRGVNLLLMEAIRWCIRNHFKYLDFGIFTVNMVPNWGLARFKESFGSLGILRDTLSREF